MVNYDEIYELMCVQCPREKECHENCDLCDAFLKRMEENEHTD